MRPSLNPPSHNSTQRSQHVRPPHAPRTTEPLVFPDSIERALKSLLTHISTSTDPKYKRAKISELQAKLDTDLFGLGPDLRQILWNSIQRLKLLNYICNFYKSLPTKDNASKRYEYFDLMFCGREGAGSAHEARIDCLVKLCSMAIQFPCYHLFDDIAIWLLKVQSNVYAKRIVSELVEDFILVPSIAKLTQQLYPLRKEAFEFSCIFTVYSITEKYMCPQLITLIGDWITEEPSEFLNFVAENPALRQHFKKECIIPMILYDVEQSLDDEAHDQFHCAITQILIQWRNANIRNEEAVRSFELDILSDLIAKSDNLPEFRGIRLIQNIKNSVRAGHYSTSEFYRCIQQFENCLIVRSGTFNEMMSNKAV